MSFFKDYIFYVLFFTGCFSLLIAIGKIIFNRRRFLSAKSQYKRLYDDLVKITEEFYHNLKKKGRREIEEFLLNEIQSRNAYARKNPKLAINLAFTIFKMCREVDSAGLPVEKAFRERALETSEARILELLHQNQALKSPILAIAFSYGLIFALALTLLLLSLNILMNFKPSILILVLGIVLCSITFILGIVFK